MKKIRKLILTTILIITLISSLYLFTKWFSNTTGYLIGEKDSVLDKCFSSKNIILYGSIKCEKCSTQKEILSNHIKSINYKDCDSSIIECQKLIKVPAWSINNKKYYGIKTLDELKILSNC